MTYFFQKGHAQPSLLKQHHQLGTKYANKLRLLVQDVPANHGEAEHGVWEGRAGLWRTPTLKDLDQARAPDEWSGR